jgi:hypothetical protein
MQLTISEETLARPGRIAKISGHTPEQVVDDTFRLSEQELLSHMPPERRSGPMAGVLQYAVVTTPPPKLQKPLQVERYNAYVALDEYDGSVW